MSGRVQQCRTIISSLSPVESFFLGRMYADEGTRRVPGPVLLSLRRRGLIGADEVTPLGANVCAVMVSENILP